MKWHEWLAMIVAALTLIALVVLLLWVVIKFHAWKQFFIGLGTGVWAMLVLRGAFYIGVWQEKRRDP
jgi:hypothetical protein